MKRGQWQKTGIVPGKVQMPFPTNPGRTMCLLKYYASTFLSLLLSIFLPALFF
jgi:hypothetical protein